MTAISTDASAGHVFQGQTLDVTYTVTNEGAATPPTMPKWTDLIYFSRDASLDLKADTYPRTAGWRATLYPAGREHSIAPGTAWERSAARAVQVAAWRTLHTHGPLMGW